MNRCNNLQKTFPQRFIADLSFLNVINSVLKTQYHVFIQDLLFCITENGFKFPVNEEMWQQCVMPLDSRRSLFISSNPGNSKETNLCSNRYCIMWFTILRKCISSLNSVSGSTYFSLPSFRMAESY